MSNNAAKNLFIYGSLLCFIVLVILTIDTMVQTYLERLLGLDYVTVKANYNLWFWVFRAIFGVGFIIGVLILVKDYFTLGKEPVPAASHASQRI